MNKFSTAFLLLPVLLAACASETGPAAVTPVAEVAPPLQASTPAPLPAETQPVAEAKPAEANPVEGVLAGKPAESQPVSRLAATPNFYHCLASWAGSMQAGLAPWTAPAKQCDTQGAGKLSNQ